MNTEERKALTVKADAQAVWILKNQAFKKGEDNSLRGMLAKAYESGYLTRDLDE